MDKRKSNLIKKLKKFRNKISKKYRVDKLIFFGSRTSDNPRKDSDIDLIVVSNKFKGVSVLKRSPDLYIEWDLDYPVDFLCYTPEEFNRLKKKITIVKEAVDNGILIK